MRYFAVTSDKHKCTHPHTHCFSFSSGQHTQDWVFKDETNTIRLHVQLCFTLCCPHPGHAGTPPQVEIRRSFPDPLKGDSVVLQCDITQLSPQDLCITFQAKGVGIPGIQFVDLPEGPGPHAVSRSLLVPEKYRTEDTSFTCSVKQGFTSNPVKSKPISNLFGETCHIVL